MSMSDWFSALTRKERKKILAVLHAARGRGLHLEYDEELFLQFLRRLEDDHASANP